MSKGDAPWPPKKENWRRDQEAFMPTVEVDLSRWLHPGWDSQVMALRKSFDQCRAAGMPAPVLAEHDLHWNKHDRQLAEVEARLVRMLVDNDPLRFVKDERPLRRMWVERIARYRDLVHPTIVKAAEEVRHVFKAITSARDSKWHREMNSMMLAGPARFTKRPIAQVQTCSPNSVTRVNMSAASGGKTMSGLAAAMAHAMISSQSMISIPATWAVFDEIDVPSERGRVSEHDVMLSLCVVRIGITREIHERHMEVLKRFSEWGAGYVGEEDAMAGFRFCASVNEMIAAEA